MDEQVPEPATAACAFCNSTETELISLFGQSLLASQYYCRNCRSVFEAVRWTAAAPGDAETTPPGRQSAPEDEEDEA